MRFLHTSDWHVGKVLKGVPRIDEQRAVLAEITELAAQRHADVVVVAGDLFETAVPSPEAMEVVLSTLLNLRATGAEVIVIGGNHDNGHMLDALSPLAEAAGVHVLGRIRPTAQANVIEVGAGGETAKIGCLPFVSQRFVIRAGELMGQDAAENAGQYAERYAALTSLVAKDFGPDTINVIVAHCMVRGGVLGGGERDAQTIEDYWVDASCFSAAAQYVALGHLHRTQQLPGAAPIWYSGSPIQIDFGEGGDTKHVLSVDIAPGKPARVEEVPLHSVRTLRTIEGTLPELEALAASAGDDLLRVIVREPARAGLADQVRELLPNAIDVRLDRLMPIGRAPRAAAGHRTSYSPPTWAKPTSSTSALNGSSPRCSTRLSGVGREAGADGADGFRGVPGSDVARLHRRRLLRPRGPHGVGEVDCHRRRLFRSLRVGPALRGQADEPLCRDSRCFRGAGVSDLRSRKFSVHGYTGRTPQCERRGVYQGGPARAHRARRRVIGGGRG
jgi:exonuclease SbcD